MPTDMRCLFNWNMDNFKSDFPSPGSNSIDKFFLYVLKNVTVLQVFFGYLIFPLTARMLGGNRLKHLPSKKKFKPIQRTTWRIARPEKSEHKFGLSHLIIYGFHLFHLCYRNNLQNLGSLRKAVRCWRPQLNLSSIHVSELLSLVNDVNSALLTDRWQLYPTWHSSQKSMYSKIYSRYTLRMFSKDTLVLNTP